MGSLNAQHIDEITDFTDLRAYSSNEASIRIFGYDIAGRDPAVVGLPVHLQNEQNVYFGDTPQQRVDVLAKGPPVTPLTAFFDYNAHHEESRWKYAEFPEHCVYTKKSGWKQRQKTFSIGRLHWVSPKDEDRWYLRILLHSDHSRGATSYTDLRTLPNGTVVPNFRTACQGPGLLDDAAEVFAALRDATELHSAPALRNLFTTILGLHESLLQSTDTARLYETFARPMADDLIAQLYGSNHGREESKSDTASTDDYNTFCEHFPLAEAYLRLTLQRDLGASLDLATLSIAPVSTATQTEIAHHLQQHVDPNAGMSPILREHTVDIDKTQQRRLFDEKWDLMARFPEQQAFVNDVRKTLASDTSKCYFLESEGGDGKTFVFNALLEHARSEGHVALAVASSGIASLLLELGRTTHSQFKAPVDEVTPDYNPTFTNNIGARTALAELVGQAKLLIWDEAPMMSKWLLGYLDFVMRDIRKNDLPFGGCCGTGYQPQR